MEQSCNLELEVEVEPASETPRQKWTPFVPPVNEMMATASNLRATACHRRRERRLQLIGPTKVAAGKQRECQKEYLVAQQRRRRRRRRSDIQFLS